MILSQTKTNVVLELSATSTQHVRTHWEASTAPVIKDTPETAQTAQVRYIPYIPPTKGLFILRLI